MTRSGLDIIDAERFVRDKHNDDVLICTRTVFHRFTFGKPDEGPRSKCSPVRDEVAFEDKHGMTARVRR